MESEDRDILLTALEQAADAVVLIDHEHKIRLYNCAAEDLWGYSRQEMLGAPVSKILPNISGSHEDASVETAPDLQIHRKDGLVLHGSLTSSKFEVDGNVHHLVFVRDVTRKVLYREQLHLLSLVVDHTDRTIVILDGQRRIVHVNRAFSQLFGLSPDEVVGSCLAELLAQNGLDAQLAERVRVGSLDAYGFTEEISTRNRFGEKVWLSLALNPILADSGEVENVVVVFTDVTSLKTIQSLQEDVLSALANGFDLPEVADFLCRRIEAIAPEVVSSLLLVDSERKLRCLAGPQLPPEYTTAIDGLSIGENVGSCGTSAFRGEPVTVTDIATDPLWEGPRSLALPLGLRACWSSPIKMRDGRVAGTFAFYYRESRDPSRFHERIVEASLHLCRLAIEHDEARRRIAQLSLFDPLTGLPNRTHLLAEGGEILKRSDAGKSVAVFAVNLDRFSDVNSSLGHTVGDKILIEAANRLKDVTSSHVATVSRTAGDSFVVVVTDCGGARASALADRVLHALGEPMSVDDITLTMGASIGISIQMGETDLPTLVKQAETAMYQAKSDGRGLYRFFSPEMNRFAQDRLVLGTALRNALSLDLLSLHYQPQINLVTNSLYGVEALARWRDPQLGDVSPARFIALAEELGLIGTIGRWSLRKACSQMAHWSEKGLIVPAVSVNLSPLHFTDRTLPKYVSDLLAEFKLPAGSLTVEITESVMMDAGPETLRTLAELHEIGVGLSMDDFGTGYSSLSSLTRLPINELKLDRSFMRNFETDVSAQAVATAVVRIGQSLGMTVVSEGVETARQAQLLTGLECNVAQGYYLARPMPAAHLERWLCAREPSTPTRLHA